MVFAMKLSRQCIFPSFAVANVIADLTQEFFHVELTQSEEYAIGCMSSRPIRSRIATNNYRVTRPTLANWKVMYFKCHTTLASILTGFSCKVVNDQCRTLLGTADSLRTLVF
jgi:hypothetical protein